MAEKKQLSPQQLEKHKAFMVTTVADNMKKYTKREIADAKVARNL